VLTPSKRRATLYTLPLIIVIGFLSVAGLAAWQRSEAIADLADQVAHGEKSEATAAVRKLAAISNPPLAILVGAAASDERAAAEAAQVSINRLLGQWQRSVDKKKRINTIAGQVTELATELARQRRAFLPADYPWLSSTTRRILQIAAKCPPKKTPLVALRCDEILAVAGTTAFDTPAVAGNSPSLKQTPTNENRTSAQPTDNRSAQQVRLENEFSKFPAQRSTTGAAPATPPAKNAPSQPQVAESESTPNTLGGETTPAAPASEPAPLYQTPDWALPVFRIAPTLTSSTDAPEEVAATDANKSADVATENPTATKTLIAKWSDATGTSKRELEEELADRGFRRLPPRVVKQYLSSSISERTRVVDSVLTEPGVDARPWLLLLADDDNPDIRLLAVTVMATSDDQSLVEAAWQVALNDQDPRIADLAGRLRLKR
jgi:hypothetical protein